LLPRTCGATIWDSFFFSELLRLACFRARFSAALVAPGLEPYFQERTPFFFLSRTPSAVGMFTPVIFSLPFPHTFVCLSSISLGRFRPVPSSFFCLKGRAFRSSPSDLHFFFTWCWLGTLTVPPAPSPFCRAFGSCTASRADRRLLESQIVPSVLRFPDPVSCQYVFLFILSPMSLSPSAFLWQPTSLKSLAPSALRLFLLSPFQGTFFRHRFLCCPICSIYPELIWFSHCRWLSDLCAKGQFFVPLPQSEPVKRRFKLKIFEVGHYL